MPGPAPARAGARHNQRVTPDAPIVTVLVADDSPVMRFALTEVLNAERDLCVVAVAGSADEAVRLAATHRPAVAILDVHMPGDGRAAAALIQGASPETRLITFTGDPGAVSALDLDRHGLADHLIKGATNAEIIAAVRKAAAKSVEPLAGGPTDSAGEPGAP